MTIKPKPTRTINPLHFEDLDPKRFEDLVRELIYDFRDWQTIEATGKGGGDDGFDIRAFERRSVITADEEGNEIIRPTEGNRWMIQCKREKSISPAKILLILKDIDPKDPPYGYMLVASTNFSKKSYDTFREELIRLGVMEFYLWGSATIETDLYQPKNDRILFTFFGISNNVRRRSRATEIRADITTKNKVMRIFGENPKHKWTLIRDVADENYPYENKCPDFDVLPPWKEYEIFDYHPLGLIFSIDRRYGYLDLAAKAFDFGGPSLAATPPREQYFFQPDAPERIERERARDYWERFPLDNRAMFEVRGVLRFNRMVAVDEKGDRAYDIPHIFADHVGGSPLSRKVEFIVHGENEFELSEFVRKPVFPKRFPSPVFGTIHDEQGLDLPERLCRDYVDFRGRDLVRIFDVGGKFAHLKINDVAVIRVAGKEDRFLQITHSYPGLPTALLQERPEIGWEIEQQIGRAPADGDLIRVLEVRPCYRHQWEKPS